MADTDDALKKFVESSIVIGKTLNEVRLAADVAAVEAAADVVKTSEAYAAVDAADASAASAEAEAVKKKGDLDVRSMIDDTPLDGDPSPDDLRAALELIKRDKFSSSLVEPTAAAALGNKRKAENVKLVKPVKPVVV